MINSHLYCLVMAGGQGTRFWPESTSSRPKQYLNLVGEKTLLSQALARFEGMVPREKRFVITTKDQALLVEKSSENLLLQQGIILEPASRNTAPCILLSLIQIIEQGAKDEDVIAIVPADHIILNTQGFQRSLQQAFELAVAKEKIVTIGIRPNFPHTGYGYIHRGHEIQDGAFEVVDFREKPDYDTALSYVKDGAYYWNAGMFVSRFDVLLEQFKLHAPEIFKFYSDLKKAAGDFSRLTELYQQIPKDSIDYTLMEKSNKILVAEAHFDWNDLGSWDALEEVCQRDGENIKVKADEIYSDGARGNIVFAPDDLVALIGVEDLVIVRKDDTLLVMKKDQSQKVKQLVDFVANHPKFKGRV